MPEFKFIKDSVTVWIIGYQPKGAVVRHRGSLVHSDGPAFELVVEMKHDDPRHFSMPYPLSVPTLRKRLAANGCLLSSGEGHKFEEMIVAFAHYIIDNFGWSKPYRHYTANQFD